MRSIDFTPGLSAWEHRRRNQRRRAFAYTVLLLGLSSASLFAVPARYNPLVTAGVLAIEQPPLDVQIPRITAAIPVRDVDMPATRPSIRAAHETDRNEAAFFARHVPQPPAAKVIEEIDDMLLNTNHSGVEQPMLALVDPTPLSRDQPAKSTSAIPTASQAVSPKAAPVREIGSTDPDRDFNEVRKRVFAADR